MLMSPALQEQARAAARAHQRRAEDTIRRLLSLWVSELEPEIAYNEEYVVIGLCHAGQIVIDA